MTWSYILNIDRGPHIKWFITIVITYNHLLSELAMVITTLVSGSSHLQPLTNHWLSGILQVGGRDSFLEAGPQIRSSVFPISNDLNIAPQHQRRMAEANSKVKLFDPKNRMEHMTIFPSWLGDIIIPLSRWQHPTIQNRLVTLSSHRLVTVADFSTRCLFVPSTQKIPPGG